MNTSPLGQQTLQTLTLTSYHVCINHRAAQLLQIVRHQGFTTGYATSQTENEHVVSVPCGLRAVAVSVYVYGFVSFPPVTYGYVATT